MAAQANLDFEGQAENLAKISKLICEFCDAKLSTDPNFHMEELLRFVKEREPSVAPDSPGRILRQLRQQGVVNYEAVNRRDSLYALRAA